MREYALLAASAGLVLGTSALPGCGGGASAPEPVESRPAATAASTNAGGGADPVARGAPAGREAQSGRPGVPPAASAERDDAGSERVAPVGRAAHRRKRSRPRAAAGRWAAGHATAPAASVDGQARGPEQPGAHRPDGNVHDVKRPRPRRRAARTSRAGGRRASAAAAETAPLTETDSRSGAWAWILGVFLALAIAGGGWLALQPPWRRWQWLGTLRAALGAWVRGWRARRAGARGGATGAGTTTTWMVAGSAWRSDPRGAGEARRAGDLAGVRPGAGVTSSTAPESDEGEKAAPGGRPAASGVAGEADTEVAPEGLLRKRRKRRITNVTLPIPLPPPRDE